MSVFRNHRLRLAGMLSITLDMLATGTMVEGSSRRMDLRIRSVGTDSEEDALLLEWTPIMAKPVQSDTATGTTCSPADGAMEAWTIGS